MTPEQFDALARLLQLREGPARAASRMVLVDGARQRDAAVLHGLTEQAMSNAMARCRRGLDLAKQAVGAE